MTAADIKNRWAELGLGSHPLDGITFLINWNNLYAFNSQRPMAWSEMDPDTLTSVNWGHFTDNFVMQWATNKYGMDWYNDNQWTTVTANERLIGKAANVSGAKGIMFDTEYYPDSGTNPWKYDSTLYPGKSFAEVQSKVRERGAQWMTALQAEYPNITVYSTFFSSMPLLTTGRNPANLPQNDYALLPAFENGMLDALGPNAKLIDGAETTYYMRDTDWFYTFSDVVKNPPAGWIAPENADKYQRQVQYGTAVWLEGTIYNSDFPVDYRSQWWQHQIYNSLATSDEYVFFFTTANIFNNNPYWASVTGPAVDGYKAAIAKYNQDTPLGYDMHTDYRPDWWSIFPGVLSNITTSPSIKIASGSGTSLKAPATLTASTTTSGSGISRIEFYINGEKSGVVYGDSRTYTWNNLPPGNYEVIARVFDSQGNHGTSASLRITVQP